MSRELRCAKEGKRNRRDESYKDEVQGGRVDDVHKDQLAINSTACSRRQASRQFNTPKIESTDASFHSNILMASNK